MKCVILAGGSGDSLWPLSRRQFPKQFMKIKEGRSLLQETVVLLGTMFANPSELVLVVNSDNLIEGEGYKEAVIAAKEYAKEGYLAVLGIKPESQSSTYGYILRDKENVKKFIFMRMRQRVC